MAKETLATNTYTKEARPRTGKRKGKFGIGFFGKARFGETSGFEIPKEALESNTLTKEALPSKIT